MVRSARLVRWRWSVVVLALAGAACGGGATAGDPAALAGLWSWDVIFRSTAGDLRLESGYEETAPVDTAAWLADHPDALVSW